MKRIIIAAAIAVLAAQAFAAELPKPGPACEASNDKEAKVCGSGSTLVLWMDMANFDKRHQVVIGQYCDLRYTVHLDPPLSREEARATICVKR